METTRIFRDDKGTFCWVYKLPMFRNFAILRTYLTAMGFALLLPAAFLLFLMVRENGFSSEVLSLLGLFAGIFAAVAFISILCYLGVAKLSGGYYVHIFRMDEDSITLSRASAGNRIAEAIGAFAASIGDDGTNPGHVMTALAQSSSPIVSTKFKDVISLKCDRGHGEIRVHSFLTWYSVFVGIDDFDFVAEYLQTHCKKARISYI